jgi:hypothetical protein
MTMGNWWTRKSGWAKTVIVLAALLILQIGLCFSTDYTVKPVLTALNGPSSDPEADLGLLVSQALLCLGTFVLLIISIIVAAAGGHFSRKGNSEGDSND